MSKIRLGLILVGLWAPIAGASNLGDFSDAQNIPSWAESAFEELLDVEVISGTDSGRLNPDRNINRAEFLKILLKATDQQILTPNQSSFRDVQVNHWFFPYVETAADIGWVQGYPDGTFRPGDNINRAEIAKLINQALEVELPRPRIDAAWYETDVEMLAQNDLLPYDATQYRFDAANFPTRAEAFEQIYRALQFSQDANVSASTSSSSSFTTSTSTPGSGYNVPAQFSPVSPTSSAGQLNLAKAGSQAKSVNVTPGQNNVTVAQLSLRSQGGAVTLNDLQWRRVGNGSITDFTALWLEVNGQKVGPNTTPSSDLVSLSFAPEVTISGSKVITLKANIASDAGLGHSERFVLFLPDWINANTNKKIGLFPFGGTDITIR